MRRVIINAAMGGWYPKGQERLLNSLHEHGYTGSVMTWNNEWPNGNYSGTCNYDIKAAALEEAIAMGYTHILWLDCSMWAVRGLDDIFKAIEEKDVYAEKNGFNCAQECSNKCINYFGMDRDIAEKIPMCSSGMLGINVSSKRGRRFAEDWIKAAKDGAFAGSRIHDGQSADPRFLHHRQDQSAASLIMYRLGIKPEEEGIFFSYAPHKKETTIFQCQGM